MTKKKLGARGKQGIPGPPGPKGSAGSAGLAGHRGPAGKAGHPGARGLSGARGATGAKGAATRAQSLKGRKRLLLSVERHIENIYGELTAQMTRMARLQTQVDELRGRLKQIL